MRGRVAVAFVAAVALSACTSGPRIVGGSAVPNVGPPGERLTYVAIGASESVGIGAEDPLRDGWTYRFYRDALPRAAVFYDLGIGGATTADALRVELPEAERLHPDVVTVWLNVNDIVAGVEPALYREEITELLTSLRGAEVFVANLPSLDSVPKLRATPGLSDVVSAYNEAISSAASAAGAHVVDLRPVVTAAIATGDPTQYISADGLHPNAAGYALVAKAFEQAYARISG